MSQPSIGKNGYFGLVSVSAILVAPGMCLHQLNTEIERIVVEERRGARVT